jgi:hypothetical protein
MKHLPVADAFRAILRTTYPERTDLMQIDSYRWFHDRRRVTRPIQVRPVKTQILPASPAPTEMTAYPTLTPRLSQFVPREKVVD